VQNLELRHNAFFNFATQYQDRFPDFEIDAAPGDMFLDAFEGYLKTESLTDLWKEAAHSPDILIEKLVYQHLFFRNQDKAWQYLMSRDFHVKAALELFPKARELFSVFNGHKGLRSEYTAELKQYAKRHAKEESP